MTSPMPVYQPLSLILHTMDSFGNYLEGGRDVAVSVDGVHLAEMKDLLDGTYEASFKGFEAPGKHTLSATIDGSHFPGSPFDLVILSPVPHPKHTILRGLRDQSPFAGH